MKKKKSEALNQAQLKAWLKAARAGHTLTETNAETKEIIILPYPLSRSDGDGLTFTLSEAGTATWVLRYRYAKRQRELTLGNYPALGLAEARQLAREKRVEIDQGGDPAHDKKQRKILVLRDWTVNQLAEDYRSKVLSQLGLSTQRSYGRALRRISTKIGSTLVTKIEALDIVNLIEELNLTWAESNMLLTTVKVLFRHAAGKKLIVSNPCTGIELSAIIGRKPLKKIRLMLEPAEIRVLLNASMSLENLLSIKILLATAVRTDELRNAKWAHLDFENKVWSIPSSKTGTAFQVPLTELVASWFLELQVLSKKSQYVLPARKDVRKKRLGGDAPINPNTIGAAIDFWLDTYKPSIRRFTPHDLRSSAKSHMRALKVPRDITEMCLNHKLKGIEGIYDIHTYFDERKAALYKWNDYLVNIQNGSDSKNQNPFEVAMRLAK